MSFEIAEVVDHYRLDRVVDRTGSVTVFEAFDLRLLRRVALKELGPDLSSDPAFRARFARDAARAAQLDHSGIASVFDSNECDGSLYFVTKFVDGVPLAELLRSRPIPVGEAIAYLDQVAAALDYAHRRGVVHGNVGLGTVLISTDDTPASAVLFDVGITKRADGDGAPWVGWFPPATGEWSPTGPAAEPDSRRVDLVGLARMAFKMLTRKAPQDALASASMLEPTLPSGVDEVFAAVLGDADRDMTCTGFVAALRRAVPSALLAARPLAPGSELPPPTPSPTEQPPSVPSTSDPERHRTLLVSGAVAAVLLVVAVLVWQGTRATNADLAGVAPGAAVSSPTTRALAPPVTAAAGPTVRPTSVSTTLRPSTTSSPTSTVAPTTTSPPSTEAPSAPPTEVPTTVVSLNQFGDVVGQPVTAPISPQAATAVALQERRLPADVAVVDTPAAYYAEWLRLTAPTPAGPPIATTADGYAIDAGVPVELNQFQATPEGGIVSFVECVAGSCTSATAGVQVNANCEPGPGCNAFATDDRLVLAVLRATVTLRSPAITLIFSVTSEAQVVAVNDPYNTVQWDDGTGAMSVTLASAPPQGTQMSVTFTYADGGRSVMAITYG